jgi:uncharacterized GH25 family protein
MISVRRLLAVSLVGSLTQAFAHSPYLLPNYFDASGRDHVSVQASFTERFFVPDVVMRADTWQVVGPDGARGPLTPVYTKDVAVLDVDTRQAGTYRISTGLRAGATRKAAQVDGEWKFYEEGEAPPQAVDMQSWTRADVYVSTGKPDEVALKPDGKALEFQLLTHPNRLQAGASLRVRLLLEGKALANQPVALAAAVDAAGDSVSARDLRTDSGGILDVPLPAAGLFHLMSRYRIAPVAAAGGAARSYTIALTFEVTE